MAATGKRPQQTQKVAQTDQCLAYRNFFKVFETHLQLVLRAVQNLCLKHSHYLKFCLSVCLLAKYIVNGF